MLYHRVDDLTPQRPMRADFVRKVFDKATEKIVLNFPHNGPMGKSPIWVKCVRSMRPIGVHRSHNPLVWVVKTTFPCDDLRGVILVNASILGVDIFSTIETNIFRVPFVDDFFVQ